GWSLTTFQSCGSPTRPRLTRNPRNSRAHSWCSGGCDEMVHWRARARGHLRDVWSVNRVASGLDSIDRQRPADCQRARQRPCTFRLESRDNSVDGGERQVASSSRRQAFHVIALYMGSPDPPGWRRPRSYHHGNLKEVLLEAARKLIEQYGPAGFSLTEA